MDFVITLVILTNEKKDNYDFIQVIVNWLVKMIYYELIKTIINALRLVGVIIDVVIHYYGFLDLIMTKLGSHFTSKIW